MEEQEPASEPFPVDPPPIVDVPPPPPPPPPWNGARTKKNRRRASIAAGVWFLLSGASAAVVAFALFAIKPDRQLQQDDEFMMGLAEFIDFVAWPTLVVGAILMLIGVRLLRQSE